MLKPPTVDTIFHVLFICKQKLSGNVPGIVAYAVILQKGRVDFLDRWLIKSNFITKDEMKACQLTRTKFPHRKVKKAFPNELGKVQNLAEFGRIWQNLAEFGNP